MIEFDIAQHLIESADFEKVMAFHEKVADVAQGQDRATIALAFAIMLRKALVSQPEESQVTTHANVCKVVHMLMHLTDFSEAPRDAAELASLPEEHFHR